MKRPNRRIGSRLSFDLWRDGLRVYVTRWHTTKAFVGPSLCYPEGTSYCPSWTVWKTRELFPLPGREVSHGFAGPKARSQPLPWRA